MTKTFFLYKLYNSIFSVYGDVLYYLPLETASTVVMVELDNYNTGLPRVVLLNFTLEEKVNF